MDFGKIITNITVPIVYNVLHRLQFQYGVKKWLIHLLEIYNNHRGLCSEPDVLGVPHTGSVFEGFLNVTVHFYRVQWGVNF